MTTLAAQAVRMQAAAFSQQVGTAVVRQQIDAQRAVADLVAETAAAVPPPGQGQAVDIKV